MTCGISGWGKDSYKSPLWVCSDIKELFSWRGSDHATTTKCSYMLGRANKSLTYRFLPFITIGAARR